MNGFEAARRAIEAQDLGATAAILLASCGVRGDAQRCRELGLAAYLTKPVRKSDLLETLALVTRKREASDLAERPGPYAPLITRHFLRENRRILKVLLAEDNAVNRALAVSLLKKRGHLVVCTGTGREALAALEKQSFDLVLMDVQMPGMNGFEATACIRMQENGSRRHLPVIAMTAHAMKGDRERCLAAGMDGYVSKPVGVEELFETIEEVMKASAMKERSVDADAAEVLDRAKTLAQVGGDEELLAEVAHIFLEEYPAAMARLKGAVAGRDSRRVMEEAHALKGSVANFGSAPVVEAVQKLEKMGRGKNLAGGTEVLERLDALLNRLARALAELCKESVNR